MCRRVRGTLEAILVGERDAPDLRVEVELLRQMCWDLASRLAVLEAMLFVPGDSMAGRRHAAQPLPAPHALSSQRSRREAQLPAEPGQPDV